MKRSTRAKLRAYWTPEKRAAARVRALARLRGEHLAEKGCSKCRGVGTMGDLVCSECGGAGYDICNLPVPVLADPDVLQAKPSLAGKTEGEVREGTSNFPMGLESDSRGGQKKLRVVRVPVNPRMVECGGETGCENVLVHVGRNGSFVVGDEIVVEAMSGQGGCWEFVRMVNEGLRVDHVGLPFDRRRWEARS